MKAKKLLSLLLAVLLCVGLLHGFSLTAFATAGEAKSIMLGTDGISAWNSTDGYDYIYMGSYNSSPVKWRVLDTKTNTNADGLFVLSEKLLGTGTYGDARFDDTSPYSSEYQGSEAQAWCDTFKTTNLNEKELSAIIATTKSDENFTSSTNSYLFTASENILNDDKIFFLSAEEAENSTYGFVNDSARIANYGESAGGWWLRSLCPHQSFYIVGIVAIDGDVKYDFVNVNWAARPAFNLNTSKVLFTAEAKNAVVSSELRGVSDYSGSGWDITLLDNARKFFDVTETALSAEAGDSVDINYSGAETGANEYVSAMIVDDSDNVLYYGQIANNAVGGTATFTIPSSLAEGDYTLKVFSEQINGDNMTDYASAFKEIALTVHTHSWDYSGNGAKITARCSGGGTCDYAGADTELTITAPAKVMYGDANLANASLSGTTLAGQASLPAIKYLGRDGTTYAESETAPANVGKYTAKITVEASTASVDYEIARATPTISTPPTASRITAGSKLEASALSGGVAKGVGDMEIAGIFAWLDGTEEMTTIENATKKVVFTPTDTTNYNTAECGVTVEVYKQSSGGGGGSTRCTVKFEANCEQEISSRTVPWNGKLTEPDEPARDGFIFDGWYTDKELTNEYDFDSKVTKSFTLYAKWEIDEEQTQPIQPTEWENPFIDVNTNDWFYDVVKEAYINGLIKGTSENTFSPNDNITRGMFITILYRAEGEPAVNKSIPFADVKAGEYYANAVIWGQQNGIIKGISETEFAPNENITREQMTAILYRYAQVKGYDASAGEDTNILSYADFDKISEYAIPAMQWACGDGIINGKGNGILDPLGNTARAEATAMLTRLFDIIK